MQLVKAFLKSWSSNLKFGSVFRRTEKLVVELSVLRGPLGKRKNNEEPGISSTKGGEEKQKNSPGFELFEKLLSITGLWVTFSISL